MMGFALLVDIFQFVHVLVCSLHLAPTTYPVHSTGAYAHHLWWLDARLLYLSLKVNQVISHATPYLTRLYPIISEIISV